MRERWKQDWFHELNGVVAGSMLAILFAAVGGGVLGVFLKAVGGSGFDLPDSDAALDFVFIGVLVVCLFWVGYLFGLSQARSDAEYEPRRAEGKERLEAEERRRRGERERWEEIEAQP
jgi:hypothetical protein